MGQAETQQNPARSWSGGDGVRATPWQSGDTAGNNAGALAGQTVAAPAGTCLSVHLCNTWRRPLTAHTLSSIKII